ncbi:collagen-like protein [Streptomyces sp. NPDC058268]|uniref:collagen-like protein n=1 Tax=Streptomyces sp. NPDC058268 TaxID=3346413 RepID=UPI0036E19063
MIQLERLLARRWRTVFLVCVLVALSGVAVLLWARIDAGDRRADRLAAETDRRGEAVSTLARDVRTLRAQVRAHGETPAAPDPSDAVEGLLARARVPGSPGATGSQGEDGKPGEKGTPGVGGRKGDAGTAGEPGFPGTPGDPGPAGSDGADGTNGERGPEGPAGAAGPPGSNGADGSNGTDGVGGASGPEGPAGPTGPRGERGPKGEAGAAGPTCPDGYSLQQPPGDPDALVCRRNGVTPADPAPAILLLATLLPRRRPTSPDTGHPSTPLRRRPLRLPSSRGSSEVPD